MKIFGGPPSKNQYKRFAKGLLLSNVAVTGLSFAPDLVVGYLVNPGATYRARVYVLIKADIMPFYNNPASFWHKISSYVDSTGVETVTLNGSATNLTADGFQSLGLAAGNNVEWYAFKF